MLYPKVIIWLSLFLSAGSSVVYAEPGEVYEQIPASASRSIGSGCKDAFARTRSFSPKAGSLLESQQDIKALGRALKNEDHGENFEAVAQPFFRELEIGGATTSVSAILPIGCNSEPCVATAALMHVINHSGSARQFEIRLKNWFERYLPGYEPLYGKSLNRELNQIADREGFLAVDGVVVHPRAYAKLLMENKIPITDIHDLSSHLPMLLQPELKTMIMKHFTTAYRFLEGVSDPWATSYFTLRANYFEQFVFFDPTSKSLYAYGGFGRSLSGALIEYLYGEVFSQDTGEVFNAINARYHGSWGQDAEAFNRLVPLTKEVAANIMTDMPKFLMLPESKQRAVLMLYLGKRLAQEPDLVHYFSLSNQIALWQQALDQFAQRRK